MAWSLAVSSESASFDLPGEGIAHLVLSLNRIGVVRALLLPYGQTELGRIDVGPWGVKLKAISDTLSIQPGQARPPGGHTTATAAALDPRTEKYELRPCTGEFSEAIFLRHGDIITSPKVAAHLTCRWTDSKVQVNSSMTDAVQVTDSAHTNGVEETPEEDTEDEDLDNTITAGSETKKLPQPQATPQFSNQQSVVVQETPTAPRITGPNNSLDVLEIEISHFEPVEETPTSSPASEREAEPFSTAYTEEPQDKASENAAKPVEPYEALPNASESPSIDALNTEVEGVNGTHEDAHQRKSKSSPQMQIPPRSSRKRASSTVDQDSSDAVSTSRFNKRAKTTKSSHDNNQDDTHGAIRDSRMENTDIEPPRKAATRTKKRLSEVAEATEEAVTPRSQRSSQRSTTAAIDTYEGPTPRVAFSNSSILKTNQAVKFLKKQGGAHVEALNDDFNILCIRDGDLPKKAKVLRAIARGVPIVTDKWLLDSAKAVHFLSLAAYKPSVPKQEKEWKFKLEDVLGQPQAPFKRINIHFTKSLKAVYQPFTEIEEVCKAAGANKVTSARINKTEDFIVLAKEDDDAEAQKLMQDGVRCYTRDLLTHSIFRGLLDLDSDEFRIDSGAVAAAGATDAPKEKKKRGREST
ncbi:hypothetical protein EJ02DRAFT_395251 [Clathrospora elynae]|uniref:BRCT domain-containing protein n=1 Tax=Clathrospora elynae TaxID=706981 RepID=A0A6A5T098_9PLEO|nr:hypothetical protein EJ02DRAFT_395251 [Clathrospora elynae]